MQKFNYNAARVSTQYLTKSKLCEAVYTGPMTKKSFDALRSECLKSSDQASVIVLRMDKALISMSDDHPVQEQVYSANSTPGAVIVRPDQYDFWQEYALKVAQFGVVRTVWLESNARLAYEWALRRADSRIAELQH